MSAIAPSAAPPYPALAVTFAGAVVATTSGTAAGLVAGDLGGFYGVSADEASWAATLYDVGQVAGILLVFALIPALGQGRLAQLAGLAFGAGALLAASGAYGPALAGRLVQGVGAGMMPALFMTLVTQSFPPGHGQREGLAVYAFSISVGTGLSGWLAGTATASGGAEALFLAQGFGGLAYAAAARLAFAPAAPPAVRWAAARGADWTGFALLALGVGALIAALSQGERRFWLVSPWVAGLLAAAAVGLALAVVHLLRAERPLVDLRLLGRPTFGWAILLAVFFRFGLLTVTWVVPQFLTRVQAYRPEEMGGVLIAATPALILAFPLAFLVCARLDARLSLSLGLLLFAASAFIDSSAAPDWAATELRLSVALAGAGQAFFIVAVLLFATAGLGPPQGATAGAIFNLTRTLGQAFGTAFLATLVTEREKWHSNRLVEGLSTTDPVTADRLAQLAAPYAGLATDSAAVSSQALRLLGQQASTQAFVLAYSDAFLALTGVLAASAALVWLLPAIGKSPAPPPAARVAASIRRTRS